MNKKILTPMRSYSQRRVYYIYREYFRMLQTANLDPIIIGPSSDDTLDFLVTHCDGLLLSGGFDIDPVLYHQVLNPLTNKEEAELEELEIKLIHKFSKAHKPILGICRGIQTINVAFNGTLIQDIPETKKYDNHLHENLEGYHHLVKTIPHTKLNKYLGNEFMTNSFHHQAIDDIAPGFVVSAITADGIIEGIEKDNIIAVQWHPEKNHDKIQAGLIKLYKELLEEEK